MGIGGNVGSGKWLIGEGVVGVKKNIVQCHSKYGKRKIVESKEWGCSFQRVRGGLWCLRAITLGQKGERSWREWAREVNS